MPRYFLIPATFVLLAMATAIGRELTMPGPRRLVAITAAAAIIGPNLAAAIHRDAFNRGQYRAAMAEAARHARAGTVTIGSDARYRGHELRTRMLVEYHARAAMPAVELRYVTSADAPDGGPDWVIAESLTNESPAPSVDWAGHSYTWHRTYPATGLSGFTWHLYRVTANSLGVSPGPN